MASRPRQAPRRFALALEQLGDPGLPSAQPGGGFNAVQRTSTFNGITTTYNLTPPRTFGIEFQYRF